MPDPALGPIRSPRPVRALPKAPPLPDTEPGVATALVTRIVIAATVLLGQLWALTVGLEASLLDHDGEAWMLALFSLVSFVVVLLVTRIDPPSRSSRLRGRANTESGTYVERPVDPRFQEVASAEHRPGEGGPVEGRPAERGRRP